MKNKTVYILAKEQADGSYLFIKNISKNNVDTTLFRHEAIEFSALDVTRAIKEEIKAEEYGVYEIKETIVKK